MATFTTTTASSGSGISQAEARLIVRQFARNMPTTVLDDAAVDRGIIAAGSEFCRRAKYRRSKATIALATNATQATGLPADFRAENLITLSYGGVTPRVVTLDDIEQAREEYTGSGDVELAYCDGSTIQLWPATLEADNLYLLYSQPFNSITELPQDIAYPILQHGAPYMLQQKNQEDKYVREAKADFERFILQMSGVGPGPQATQMRRAPRAGSRRSPDVYLRPAQL